MGAAKSMAATAIIDNVIVVGVIIVPSPFTIFSVVEQQEQEPYHSVAVRLNILIS
jgi:hypothetical protein